MKRAIATLILASLLMSTLPLNVSADETEDIPTNAQATGYHATLVDAVIQAGLLETLQGDGPFTVFAPTDAAFEAAGVDLSTFTTDEDNQTLANILTYHVVAGSVAAADVTDGMTAATVNGAELSFGVADGVVTVNDAKVTTADVMASNGIIHVIDAVLTPPAAEPVGPTLNIPETADSTGVHTSLVAALSHAGLVETLQGDGPFTVFAPTDEAFAAAGIDLAAFDTAEENETLSDILLYHVLSGAVPSSDVTDALTVTMVNGDNASFTVTADGVTIEGANVTTADVETTNGFIHVIDKVLMPPADAVVVPDIPSIAASTGVHDALVAALTKADLVATLQGEGPFTVFAPTDQAFADAGIDLDAFTTEEEIAVLADILLYHVLSGAVASSDVTDGLTVTMVNGDDASFTVTADGVTIEGANVTTADVTGSNGIVHVIDKVLMPPADEPVLPDCDAIVGIAPSGLKYSPATLSISVGDTVCWQWTDSGMAHNVRQVDGEESTTYTQDGITSGEAATTVDFRYTFTEDDTTFYYACEPHLAAGMYGKVIVGTGGATAVVEPAEPVDTSDEDENTPGFVSTTLIVALLGAVLFLQRRQSA